MDYLAKIGLLAHCLIIPAVWGLLVEWIFHAVRVKRRRQNARPGNDARRPLSDWSGQQ